MYQLTRVTLAIQVMLVAIFLANCDKGAGDDTPFREMSDGDELRSIEAEVESAISSSDLERAYELLLPFAIAGNHEAQLSIGHVVLWDSTGEIFAIDMAEREHRAIAWIRQSAGQGNERAIRAMYSAYERGWYGLPRSEILEECWRGVVSFSGGIAESSLTLAAACMAADAPLFQ